MKDHFVYILSNKYKGVIYIGFTNNLENRFRAHKEGLFSGFTKKYNVTKLVYYEVYQTAVEALEREKQMKKWNRDWKIEIIEKSNPLWRDLSM